MTWYGGDGSDEAEISSYPPQGEILAGAKGSIPATWRKSNVLAELRLCAYPGGRGAYLLVFD